MGGWVKWRFFQVGFFEKPQVGKSGLPTSVPTLVQGWVGKKRSGTNDQTESLRGRKTNEGQSLESEVLV